MTDGLAADGGAAPPFFETVLTTLVHDAGLMTQGAATTVLACVGAGKADVAVTLATLHTAAVASHVRLGLHSTITPHPHP